MASGDTLCTFFPADNEPPSTNYATLDTRNGHPVLDFDTTTGESAIFTGIMPQSYSGATGVTVILHWMASSATSGTIGWLVGFEAMKDGGDDMDSDSFAADNTVTAETVDGTSGIIDVSSTTFTDGADMDSVTAGDAFRIKITRDVGTDTAAGDAELLAVEIRET